MIFHRGPHDLEMIREEHGHTGGVDAGIPGKKVIIVEDTPTSPHKSNPSLVLGYDGSGNLTTITKTIGAVQYQQTLTYNGTNVLTNISAWVQL